MFMVLVSVIACKEKAQFLLKFAGLQRITEKCSEVRCLPSLECTKNGNGIMDEP